MGQLKERAAAPQNKRGQVAPPPCRISASHEARASILLRNNVDVGVPRYLLFLFPILMSLGFAVFFIWAASLVKWTRADVMNISQALGLQVFPEMRVLAMLLKLTGGLFIVVALGVLAIICHATHR